MDNQEKLLELEVDSTVDTVASEDDTDFDFDFGVDEDGEIAIPEDNEDTEDDRGENTDVSRNNSQMQESEQEAPKPQKSAREIELENELADLRRKNVRLESVGKDVLKKLGIESPDIISGFARVASEGEMTPEEYLRKHVEAEQNADNARFANQVRYEAIFAADIKALHDVFPETAQYESIRDLPEDIRNKFANYRDKGLDAKAAYAAANPDGIRQAVASSVKQKSANSGKEHMKSVVPKGSRDDSGPTMTKKEVEEWRDMFPDKSDKELLKLYRSTKT